MWKTNTIFEQEMVIDYIRAQTNWRQEDTSLISAIADTDRSNEKINTDFFVASISVGNGTVNVG